MTRFLLTTTSALAAAALSLPAHAQVDPAVSLNFYLTEAAYSGCGLFDDTATSQCDDLAFSPRPGPAQLWVIVSRADGFPDGLASVGFGVIHNALEVQSWANCTGGAFFQGFGRHRSVATTAFRCRSSRVPGARSSPRIGDTPSMVTTTTTTTTKDM